MLANNLAEEKNQSNTVYSHPYSRFKTENKIEISINFSGSIQLVDFISSIKLLHIINLS